MERGLPSDHHQRIAEEEERVNREVEELQGKVAGEIGEESVMKEVNRLRAVFVEKKAEPTGH